MAKAKNISILALATGMALGFLLSCEEANNPPEVPNITHLTTSQGYEVPFMTPQIDRIEWWRCGNDRCQQVEKGDFLLIEERGPLAFIDSGSAVDGPAYIIEKKTGNILGYCGGHLMLGEIAEYPCDFDYWLERI